MNWFTRMFSSAGSTLKSASKTISVGVRQMLSGALAGSWATDHREEVNHFTGFNYVAVHAIASQVMGAEVTAFIDDKQQRGVSRRKAIRAKYYTLAKYKSLYGTDEKETTPLDSDHPLMELLKKPNPHETGAMFRYKQAMQIRLTGTCLVWNVPGGGEKVRGKSFAATCERYVLPTAMTTPVMASPDMPMGGWRVSGYSSRYIPLDDQGFVEGSPTWTNILGQVIDARQVQLIRLPHAWWFDDGQSPTSAGAQWIDTEAGVNAARVGQLRNGADPSLLWTLPPDVSPDQDEIDRATLKVNKKYAGPENSGKILIATNGTEIEKLSTTPKEMCYGEAFQDVKSSVLALHQTPPVAVGLQESGAYAAYYASMLAWRHSAIQPLCDMLAESDTQHLATQFGQGITIEIEAPMIDDKDQEEKEFQNNVTARVCTLNELRARRGLPRYEGPEGDQLWPPQQQKAGPSGVGDPGNLNPQTQSQQSQQQDDSEAIQFPSTPFMRKSMRAAWEAVEEADKEWLGSRLKSRDPNKPRKFSSTQINVPQPLARQIIEWGKKWVPESELTDDGLEDQPHVTVLYGLHTANPRFVENAVSGFGQVVIHFGVVTRFECPEYDVLKVSVEPSKLPELRELIEDACENTQTYPDYVPHCTIAYVKKGSCLNLDGSEFMLGKSFAATELMFSGVDGTKQDIPLADMKSLGMSTAAGSDGAFLVKPDEGRRPPNPAEAKQLFKMHAATLSGDSKGHANGANV